MTARFVQVIPEALLDVSQRHGLRTAERLLLRVLVEWADHRTGVWTGTQRGLGDLVGINRNRVRVHVDVLERWGLVEANFVHGKAGTVKVLIYADVVHQRPPDPAQEQPRTGRPRLRSVPGGA